MAVLVADFQILCTLHSQKSQVQVLELLRNRNFRTEKLVPVQILELSLRGSRLTALWMVCMRCCCCVLIGTNPNLRIRWTIYFCRLFAESSTCWLCPTGHHFRAPSFPLQKNRRIICFWRQQSAFPLQVPYRREVGENRIC